MAFQLAEIDRRHRPRRVAEGHHHPERRETVERLVEGVLADAVEDDRHALATGDLLHAREEIVLLVVDAVRRAVRLRELALLVRPRRANRRHAERLQPLAGDEPDASGRRMKDDGVARLHLVKALDQILDGHPLEHHRGGLLGRDAVGNLHDARRRDVARFTVAADRLQRRAARVDDAVAGLELGDAVADGFDDARRLAADAARQRDLVDAAAMVRVDVVEADRFVAHADLAGAGRREIHVLPLHDFRSTLFVNPDRFRHGSSRVMTNGLRPSPGGESEGYRIVRDC